MCQETTLLSVIADCQHSSRDRERRLLGEARFGEEYLCSFQSRSNSAFGLQAIDDAFGAEMGIGAPWLDEDDGAEEVIHRGPAIQFAV